MNENGVLGVGPATIRGCHAEDVRAEFDPGYSVTDLVNHAGGVVSRPEREPHTFARTGPNGGFARGEAGSAHGNADLPGSGVRFGDIGDVHDAGRAILGKLDGFHASDGIPAGQRFRRK
ncbi:hypothetical protein GCM10009565_64770 [Amycolatopsis albidoflavus]